MSQNRRNDGTGGAAVSFFVLALFLLSWVSGCGRGVEQPEPSLPAEPEPEPEIVENPVFVTESEDIRSGWISAVCLNVRGGPGTATEVVGHAFQGDRVDILDEQRVSGTRWYRVVDEAGYVHGWVSAAFVSGDPVSSRTVIPDSYKEPRTPTIIDGIPARYLGSRACKRCHSETHGEFANGEYGTWTELYHADAYRSLTRPYTIALARRRGIDDPATDWRCLKCHVTAYGAPAGRIGPNYSELEGVGCEACHGPGEDYLQPHQDGSASEDELAAMGFRLFRDLAARDRLCRACHNELSPTYKQFNVDAFSAEIRHWEERFTQTIRETTSPAMQASIAPRKIDAAERRRQLEELEKIRELAKEIDAAAEKAKPKPVTPPSPELVTPPSPEPVIPPSPEPVTPPLPEPVAPPPSEPVTPPSPGGRLAGAKKEMMLGVSSTKGQVFFPHQDHLGYVAANSGGDNCQVCHHMTNPPDVPPSCGSCHGTSTRRTRKHAFHGSCRTCHREQGGPTKCAECHNP